MDTKLLIKKLNEVFCNNNKTGKKYAEVWLTEVDLGGLYDNGKFVLCLKAEHEIGSCYDETEEIINLLSKEAPKELDYIWRVVIYDIDDEIHCESYELKVFDESNSC
jgi:serine phosphatase RsbU (regulator of sigma subunit)